MIKNKQRALDRACSADGWYSHLLNSALAAGWDAEALFAYAEGFLHPRALRVSPTALHFALIFHGSRDGSRFLKRFQQTALQP